MKKIFLFFVILTFQALFTITNLPHAHCNEGVIDAPDTTFKIHGTEAEKATIEGERLEELLRAIAEGKDIDIEYARIKGGIDFTDADYFTAYTFSALSEEEKNDLFTPDEIAHIKYI